jgi:hypothetical protein
VANEYRVTHKSLEVLHAGAALGRLTWNGVEVLNDGAAAGRLSAIGVEVLRDAASVPNRAQVTTMGVEVLMDYPTNHGLGRRMSLM